MGEETKINNQQEPETSPPTGFAKAGKDESEEKGLIPVPIEPSSIAAKKDADDREVGKTTGKLNDRDAALAQVEREKRLALIKAWEDNEKSKADNKAHKKLSSVDAWENAKRANIETELRQIEEKIEQKKAEYAEKMKNKMAILHKAAEEKRASVEADRGKAFLAVEEAAAKYRTAGRVPKKSFACFGC